ncbi:mRNA capping enzyme [Plasmodium gonderi]|uniref:mRNA guanylyltransferase n=1 Tax=Plasmodium gonderi TaxID=77519 RepID=A0A1Y1JLE2_PLAGO|nr:mRNA capping enzyme [Plasmodium gonderi]GAW83070.1 mRNA capping enzyme [Plasmodium gonderi]
MIRDIYNPGEKIENEFLKEKIRSKINDMLKWKRKGFPGSNPVSLTKHNIKNLLNKDYLICEKTDGVRYFLFIASNTTFLIDRNYEIFKNDMHIPNHDDLTMKQQLTLLDGELVEDTVFNEKKGVEENKIVYLIYDGLYIHRKDITSLNYLERLTNVYNFVIIPLKKYQKQKHRMNNPTAHISTISFESPHAHLPVKKNETGSVNNNPSDTMVGENDKKATLDQWNSNSRCIPSFKRNANQDLMEHDFMDDGDVHADVQYGGATSAVAVAAGSDRNCDNDENDEEQEDTSSSSHSDMLPEEENAPFEIYLKDFYHIRQITELIQTIKKLPHASDGIIFTPLNHPYKTGNFFELLKWKPLNLNTVDFGIETIYDKNNFPNKFELFISIKGVRTSYKTYLAEYGDVYKELLNLALSNQISHYIIECYYVSKHIFSICKNENGIEEKIEGGWIAQKIRFDKNIPNDISTLNKVIQSILDNITIDSLIKEISRNHPIKH